MKFMEGPRSAQFEADYCWNDVEGLFDLLEKIIEIEKSVDGPDDAADLEWFDPIRCEEKADHFMKWLKIEIDDPNWTISMVVNESKSRYELWLNSNGAIASDVDPDPEFWLPVPPETIMTGGASAKKLGELFQNLKQW